MTVEEVLQSTMVFSGIAESPISELLSNVDG